MKKAALIIMVLLLAAPVSFASDSKNSWLSELKKKIEKLVPSKKTSKTNVVGGVRGGAENTIEALYWKGKEEEITIGDAELKAFKAALQTALNGKSQKSIGQFEDFIAQYPESPLSNEAKKTVKLLKGQ